MKKIKKCTYLFTMLCVVLIFNTSILAAEDTAGTNKVQTADEAPQVTDFEIKFDLDRSMELIFPTETVETSRPEPSLFQRITQKNPTEYEIEGEILLPDDSSEYRPVITIVPDVEFDMPVDNIGIEKTGDVVNNSNSDTDEIADNEADNDDAIDDETDIDEVPDNETDIDEVPNNEADTDEAPDNETDINEAPDNETDTDEAPDNEADTDEIPDNETDIDEAPDNETDTDEIVDDETDTIDPDVDEPDVNENDINENNLNNNTSIQYAAALPDLAFTSITISQASGTPLQALAPTKISFVMTNKGAVTANNVTLGLYENNVQLADLQLGTFPANATGNFNFTFQDGFLYGTNVIALRADPSNAITETNESNNIITKTAVFTGAPNITISNFDITTSGDIVTMKPIHYSFNISNRGNAPSNPGTLYVNYGNQPAASLSLPALNPYYSGTGSFNITFAKKGNYTVKIVLDNSPSTQSRYTYVDFDTEIWAGRWDSAEDLSVQAYSNATDIFSKSFLESYLEWNGINDNVSFQPYATDSYDENLMCDITMEAYSFIDNTLGRADMYKSGLLGFFIPINDVLADDSTYAKARILLDIDLTAERTVIHEFGHAVGLKHPECADTAVMHQTREPEKSNSIEAHDVHSLAARYD